MSKFIRDGQGKLVGRVIENGNVTYIPDGAGHLKGQHLKSVDKTFDERGKFVGPGDQLLRLLGE